MRDAAPPTARAVSRLPDPMSNVAKPRCHARSSPAMAVSRGGGIRFPTVPAVPSPARIGRIRRLRTSVRRPPVQSESGKVIRKPTANPPGRLRVLAGRRRSPRYGYPARRGRWRGPCRSARVSPCREEGFEQSSCRSPPTPVRRRSRRSRPSGAGFGSRSPAPTARRGPPHCPPDAKGRGRRRPAAAAGPRSFRRPGTLSLDTAPATAEAAQRASTVPGVRPVSARGQFAHSRHERRQAAARPARCWRGTAPAPRATSRRPNRG
jgi:hypothetical protein